MSKPFITGGTVIAPMLGRSRIHNRVINMITKPTPDNVSIVGPKLYGKTVFLNNLNAQMEMNSEYYLKSIYVDLRHGTPQSDNEFIIKFADSIQKAFQKYDPELAQILKEDDPENLVEMLYLVFEALEDKKKRLLTIFDGFDFLPLGTGLSPNLLDQLRSLVEKSSLCFVIGSRKRLRDLCKTEASRTSDFWRIFAEPVTIGPFEEEDWGQLWIPFDEKKISIEKGAKTELQSQTAGIPVLVSAILEELYSTTPENSKLTNLEVSDCCKKIISEPSDALRDLWDDCSIELQRLISEAISTDLEERNIPTQMISEAKLKGLALIQKGVFKIQSRIINEYAKRMATSVQDINRLFGTSDNFEHNIRKLIELRLSHFQGCNERLYHDIEYAVRDLTDESRRVLDTARGIIEDALDIILSAEGVQSGQEFPSEWKEKWEKTNIKGVPDNFNPVPNDRGLLCSFIRHITGREPRYIRVASKISRHTSLLIDQVNSIGNFINHREWETPSYGLACSMCFLAIELMASINKDLSE